MHLPGNAIFHVFFLRHAAEKIDYGKRAAVGDAKRHHGVDGEFEAPVDFEDVVIERRMESLANIIPIR